VFPDVVSSSESEVEDDPIRVDVEVQIHEGAEIVDILDDNESDIEPLPQRPRLE
jgi:hypothetical protein